MNSHDALFEDIQAFNDNAEASELKDVVLVLEFAMDAFLRDTGTQNAVIVTETPCLDRFGEQVNPDKAQETKNEMQIGCSMSTFPLMRA